MKINVSVSHTVNINPNQMKDITIETLCRLFDIPKEYASIDDEGNLIQWVDTHHGSGFDEKIRKATKEDKMILEIINKIRTSKD